MIRRSLEVAALVATFAALVATSPAPNRCATEVLNVRAQTSCGPDSNVSFTSDLSCSINGAGADFGGLPSSGTISGYQNDAGFDTGFSLTASSTDGGLNVDCTVTPSVDGGFTLSCERCGYAADGGGYGCDAGCSGVLTPQ